MGIIGSYATALQWGLNEPMFGSRKYRACPIATMCPFADAASADGDDNVGKMFTPWYFNFKAKKSIN